MYTGHFGIALAAKGIDDRLPLWACIAAAFAPDLVISGSQIVAGIPQKSIEPLVSSLPGGLMLALLVGLMYKWGAKSTWGSLILAGISFLHVVADFITGRAHLWPGGPEVGLHLYRFEYADFALESSLVIAGWLLYHRTLPKHKQRTWPAWLILAFLIGLQLFFEIRPLFLGG